VGRSGPAILVLNVLTEDGGGLAADRVGEILARPLPLGSPGVAAHVRKLLAQQREDTPLRLLTKREMATVGGKLTIR